MKKKRRPDFNSSRGKEGKTSLRYLSFPSAQKKERRGEKAFHRERGRALFIFMAAFPSWGKGKKERIGVLSLYGNTKRRELT